MKTNYCVDCMKFITIVLDYHNKESVLERLFPQTWLCKNYPKVEKALKKKKRIRIYVCLITCKVYLFNWKVFERKACSAFDDADK